MSNIVSIPDGVPRVVMRLEGAALGIMLRDLPAGPQQFPPFFFLKIASSCQRSFYPMTRRKLFSVARNDAAAQRTPIGHVSLATHTTRRRDRAAV